MPTANPGGRHRLSFRNYGMEYISRFKKRSHSDIEHLHAEIFLCGPVRGLEAVFRGILHCWPVHWIGTLKYLPKASNAIHLMY